MSTNNGYFKQTDDTVSRVAGMDLPEDWWSRPYEYAWAEYYGTGIVADMGCGAQYRPFRDELARLCDKVYAVDSNPKILEQDFAPNTTALVSDFSYPTPIPPHTLDRVFCISVLEDLGERLSNALHEFKRVLKNDGLVVLTMDVQHDYNKPLGKYPAVNFPAFLDAMDREGLFFAGDIDMSRRGVVHNNIFNLCCFHCVLEIT